MKNHIDVVTVTLPVLCVLPNWCSVKSQTVRPSGTAAFFLRDMNSRSLTGELHASLNAPLKKMIDCCQEKQLMSQELETITYVFLAGQSQWSGNKDK